MLPLDSEMISSLSVHVELTPVPMARLSPAGPTVAIFNGKMIVSYTASPTGGSAATATLRVALTIP